MALCGEQVSKLSLARASEVAVVSRSSLGVHRVGCRSVAHDGTWCGIAWSASASWKETKWGFVRGASQSPQIAKKGLKGARAKAGAGSEEVNSAGGPEGYLPSAAFYKIEAILRPWRLSYVASALIKMGIRGVTVSDVRGFGAQGGSRERQAGSEFTEDSFVTKVKLELVVSAEQVEEVIDTVIDKARTGEIGDGKIFVLPVSDIIRVRTGERGLQAERMAGGRAELLASARSAAPTNGH